MYCVYQKVDYIFSVRGLYIFFVFKRAVEWGGSVKRGGCFFPFLLSASEPPAIWGTKRTATVGGERGRRKWLFPRIVGLLTVVETEK